MNESTPAFLILHNRRFMIMAAITVGCALLAAAAVFGAIRYNIEWLWGAFVAMLLIGFASHIWFILGFAKAGKVE